MRLRTLIRRSWLSVMLGAMPSVAQEAPPASGPAPSSPESRSPIESASPISSTPDASPSVDKEESTDGTYRYRGGGFVAGLRSGLILPGGGRSDHVGAGIVARPELAIRFGRFFGLRGSFAFAALSTGPALNELENTSNVTITTSAHGALYQAGISFFAMTAPEYLGLYGELGVVPFDHVSWRQDLASTIPEECSNRGKSSGVAARLGGGVRIPLGAFALIPTLEGSIGSVYSSSSTSDCIPPTSIPLQDWPAPSKGLLYSAFLGVGGDFHFGDKLFK